MTPLKAKLALFGRSGLRGTPPAPIHEAAADAFSSAYQLLWASPEASHFTEETKTVSVLAATASYTLPTNILKIIGPTRLGTTDLIQVTEWANFQRPALIGLSLSSTGTPMIFHVATGRAQTGGIDQPNLTAMVMMLKPTPTAIGTISYIAKTHPPTFTAWDLENDTSDLPAPADYVESVILPIAARHMSRQPWFPKDVDREALETDYQMALSLIELLNPASP